MEAEPNKKTEPHCLVCGQPLTGQKKKFCSKECRWKDYERKRKKITKLCPYCGDSFLTIDSRKIHCSRSCAASANNVGRKGELARNWKGGRRTHNGYVVLYEPDNPMAQKHGEIYEHRKVASQKFPFTLPSTIPVHHLNGDKTDNRPENVEAIRSQSAHMKRHHGRPDWKDG